MNRTTFAAAFGTAVVAATAGVARAEPAHLPELIGAPTGWLLPARAVYTQSSIDTDGGYGWDARIGLGGVAEFGLAGSTLMARDVVAPAPPQRALAVPLGGPATGGVGKRVAFESASFRLGLTEDRLFSGQPGIVLGFRKSFARETDDHTTKFANLHLATSVRLGSSAAFHTGVMMWDVAIERDGAPTTALHDRGLRHQVRAFGGLEVRVRPRTSLVVDLTWEPELCYGCGAKEIELVPVLSPGLRYELWECMTMESGVRVGDVDDVHLTDVEIFGKLTFVSQRLRRHRW